ncbi:MAG: hypothetical protein Salg2KO_10840 [Salibacteraceae bacterium]
MKVFYDLPEVPPDPIEPGGIRVTIVEYQYEELGDFVVKSHVKSDTDRLA